LPMDSAISRPVTGSGYRRTEPSGNRMFGISSGDFDRPAGRRAIVPESAATRSGGAGQGLRWRGCQLGTSTSPGGVHRGGCCRGIHQQGTIRLKAVSRGHPSAGRLHPRARRPAPTADTVRTSVGERISPGTLIETRSHTIRDTRQARGELREDRSSAAIGDTHQCGRGHPSAQPGRPSGRHLGTPIDSGAAARGRLSGQENACPRLASAERNAPNIPGATC